MHSVEVYGITMVFKTNSMLQHSILYREQTHNEILDTPDSSTGLRELRTFLQKESVVMSIHTCMYCMYSVATTVIYLVRDP